MFLASPARWRPAAPAAAQAAPTSIGWRRRVRANKKRRLKKRVHLENLAKQMGFGSQLLQSAPRLCCGSILMEEPTLRGCKSFDMVWQFCGLWRSYRMIQSYFQLRTGCNNANGWWIIFDKFGFSTVSELRCKRKALLSAVSPLLSGSSTLAPVGLR